MKKILILVLMVIFLSGCTSSGDNLKNFKDHNSKFTTYELKGNMKIISNEDEFTYKIKVSVKDQEYYKVSLTNTINNHEQIILRNDDGVYVVTPSLNKSFKFMSEWPHNSSQAYLLENLVDDVNKDNKATIKSVDGGYEITSAVNYPNNQKMKKEIIKTDKDYNITSVEILDDKDLVLMSVEIKDINKSPKYDKDYFSLDKINPDIKEEDKNESTTSSSDKKKPTTTTTSTTGNGTSTTTTTKKVTEKDCIAECKDEECKKNCKATESSNIIEDIIYPLYVPVDTYLSSKDMLETKNGNRVILTFAGVDPFILVEEVASVSEEMEIIPVSGEPIQMGDSIGALSMNSLFFTSNGIDYYLTSNTLDKEEMILVAESITNGANLVAGVK